MTQSRRLILSGLILLVLAGAGAAFVTILEDDRVDQERRQVTLVGVGKVHSLERQLSRSLSTTFVLASLLRQSERVAVDNFDVVAEELIQSYGGISSLQLAPDGVVQKVYPLAGNEAAIGHDLLSDPDRRTEALAAIQSRKLTLAGPVDLIQGGVAVIGRLPVFTPDISTPENGDRFWGFAIAVIQMSQLSQAIRLDDLRENGLEYQLSRIHPDLGERHPFSGSTGTALESPVVLEVEVPNSAWTLSVAPVGGWRSSQSLVPELALVLGSSLLVSILVYVLLSTAEHRTATQQYLDTILFNLPLGVAILEGSEFRYFRINRTLAEINGLSVEDHLGRPLVEVLPEAAQTILPRMREVMETGEPALHNEFSMRMPDPDEIRWFIDWFFPIMGTDEKPEAVGAVVLDITQRKEAEEALQKVHHELEERVRQRTAELEKITDELKASHQQASSLAAHLQSIQEQERVAIARELHDELGQTLTAARIDLTMLARDLTDELADRSQMAPDLEAIAAHLDTTIKRVRGFVTELRPEILDDLGLLPTLEWQAEQFGARTGLACTFVSTVENVDLDGDHSIAVYRIFQEALTNIARHANATAVDIGVVRSNGRVLLKVVDDGIGFKEAETDHVRTFGLLGMRERALMFGGHVEITSTVGKGTTVEVEIPIGQREVEG